MQMKFLNNLSPPHEEAGGEVGKWCCANIPTMTGVGGTHTKCVGVTFATRQNWAIIIHDLIQMNTNQMYISHNN